MNKEKYKEFCEQLKTYHFDNDKMKKCFVKAIDNQGIISIEDFLEMSSALNTLTEQALLLAFANVLEWLSESTK